jgi:hypothetical protein
MEIGQSKLRNKEESVRPIVSLHAGRQRGLGQK